MLRVRTGARALIAASCVALAGCPAPPLDDPNDFDVVPYDAVPGDLSLAPAPSCAPESIEDLNAIGLRNGNTFQILVDTRNARNDLHHTCVFEDSTEVVLRYTSPAASERFVAAIRVTTITAQTIADANSGEVPADTMDPTTYDTVLGIRLACDSRDIDCNDDAFVADANGVTHATRRSTVYEVGVAPETPYLIVVDGSSGARGTALVTLEEIPQLGVAGAPCVPVPIQRMNDVTAPTAYFRCPSPGIQCLPGAGADGTDLCVPIVVLGAPCDPEHHINVCDRFYDGVVCAQNPSRADDVKCALPGTAAGAPCRGVRGAPNRCDAGLYCSPQPQGSTLPDQCVEIRHQGDTCDPEQTGAINHCDTGLVCCAIAPDAGAETECEPAGSANCYPVNVP